MRARHLDLNLLPVLQVLLQECSVTKAAKVLHVTQPAMSGMLSRLRAYFDDPLLTLVGNKMIRTPLGDSLLDPLEDLRLRISATTAIRTVFDPATASRHFSIAASDYVVSVLLLPVLRQIHAEAPNITITLYPPRPDVMEKLDKGEIDFLIVPDQFCRSKQMSAVVIRDTYHAVVDASNQSAPDEISLEQYKAMPHVIFDRASGRPWYDLWFSHTHGNGRKISIIAQSFHDLAPLVVGTQRICTMPSRLARTVQQMYPVRLLRLGFEVPPMVETLQWNALKTSDPGLQWLKERILAAA